ncbi:MAG: hypothetical protein ACKOF3_02720 [Spartobacteria bacterium]
MNAILDSGSIPFALASSTAEGWLDAGLRLASLLGGVWLLWAAIAAAVGVMLVPRPTSGLLSRLLAKGMHVCFHFCASRMRNYEMLDRFLAAQGPSTVLFYLAFFLGIFVAAFAFIFYGITGLGFSQALYQAGSGMTTLGITETLGPWGVAVVFAAAFMGSTVISVFIGYLLTLYSAYTARETTMSELALQCGDPAWGPEFLVRLKLIQGSVDATSAENLITWMCSLRVTHYIYSILNHFRSPIPNRHWVVTLLSVLDAAAIRLAATRAEPDLKLVRLIAEGADTLHMLRLSELARTNSRVDSHGMSTWRIESAILHHQVESEKAAQDPGITRSEWDWAMGFLTENGITLKEDAEVSWKIFCQLRSHYYEPAYFLAETLFAVHAPWSGQRGMKSAAGSTVLWPQLAQQRQRTIPFP